MGLDAINEFWKRLTSQEIDIDVGSTFKESIDKSFWIDYDQDVAANDPPAAVPHTFELRQRWTRRTILYQHKGRFLCRNTKELTYVAVPETVP